MRWTHSCTRLTDATFSRNKYNEWVLCLKKNDKDESKCFLPRFNMRELCPGEWVSIHLCMVALNVFLWGEMPVDGPQKTGLLSDQPILTHLHQLCSRPYARTQVEKWDADRDAEKFAGLQ